MKMLIGTRENLARTVFTALCLAIIAHVSTAFAGKGSGNGNGDEINKSPFALQGEEQFPSQGPSEGFRPGDKLLEEFRNSQGNIPEILYRPVSPGDKFRAGYLFIGETPKAYMTNYTVEDYMSSASSETSTIQAPLLASAVLGNQGPLLNQPYFSQEYLAQGPILMRGVHFPEFFRAPSPSGLLFVDRDGSPVIEFRRSSRLKNAILMVVYSHPTLNTCSGGRGLNYRDSQGNPISGKESPFPKVQHGIDGICTVGYYWTEAAESPNKTTVHTSSHDNNRLDNPRFNHGSNG